MLASLRFVNEQRFSWLRNDFLKLFQDWLNYERDTGQRMLYVEWQTYGGLKTSVNSFIEAIQFLFCHQVKYVLTERFCQDPLENLFGRQRSLGSR